MEPIEIAGGIYALAVTGGTVITIPGFLMNRVQKAMTKVDNLLTKAELQDAAHAQMFMDIKKDLDDAYTQIAGGTITLMGAYRAYKDIKAAYDEFESYVAPPNPAPKNLEQVVADIKANGREGRQDRRGDQGSDPGDSRPGRPRPDHGRPGHKEGVNMDSTSANTIATIAVTTMENYMTSMLGNVKGAALNAGYTAADLNDIVILGQAFLATQDPGPVVHR